MRDRLIVMQWLVNKKQTDRQWCSDRWTSDRQTDRDVLTSEQETDRQRDKHWPLCLAWTWVWAQLQWGQWCETGGWQPKSRIESWRWCHRTKSQDICNHKYDVIVPSQGICNHKYDVIVPSQGTCNHKYDVIITRVKVSVTTSKMYGQLVIVFYYPVHCTGSLQDYQTLCYL